MPTIVLHIYDAGLYADFGINIYYLGAAIYGWMMWKYGSFVKRKLHLRIKEGQQELPITRMPIKYYLPLGIVIDENVDSRHDDARYPKIDTRPVF